MTNVKNKFIGIWRFVRCAEMQTNGDVLYPWGEDAIGYIIYMPEDIMAVQIMRQNRKAFNVDNFMLAPAEECHALPKDYNAYFGSYTLDEPKNTIVHHIQGHLFPNLVGKDNVRHYQFEGNRLLLTTGGGNNRRELVWEKVGLS